MKMKDTATNRIITKRWENPDTALLQALKDVRWTSHNIPLTFSESTLGDAQPLICDDTRVTLIKENLGTFLGGDGDLSGRRLLDLGCLEGGLSFEMAREDMTVLGVEGRQANYDKCRLIGDYFGLPNLRFINLDVKQLNPREHGVFDAALCCGILYHLDDPVGFLETLSSMTHARSVLFLDTHFAPGDAELANCVHREHLSAMKTLVHKGVAYWGRWYQEYPQEAGGSDNEWTAVSNYRSFWLTYDALIMALYHVGFRRIYHLHGGFEIETELDLKARYSRLYCVALKEE